MCDDTREGLAPYTRLSAQAFGAFAGVGAGGAAGEGAGGGIEVAETDVQIPTAEGIADCALLAPKGDGPFPGVLMWPDAAGLRPQIRDMAKRLAASGYVVLVPNQYYRSGTAPAIEADGRGHNVEQRQAMRAQISEPGLQDDIRAYTGFLTAQPHVSKGRIGTHGYCMGGTFAFRTAEAVPDLVGAVGSFHGGALVTDKPNSPHHVIGASKANWLICVAQDDDVKKPDARPALAKALADSGRSGVVDLYAADHGWCVLGHKKYNPAEAERAWAELLKLYKAAL